MSESQELQQQISASVEDLAERFVMADHGDADFLAEAASILESLATDLERGFPRSSGAARSAARRLHDAVSRDEVLVETDVAYVEGALSGLQHFAARGLVETEVDYPEAAPVAADGMPLDGEPDFTPVAGFDEAIMAEYIGHQESVVSDMEDLLLTYDTEPDPELLVQLKRLLHTAKGEAGVLGINRVEAVLHEVENYIAAAGIDLKIDLLLEFKDWFEHVVAALGQGQTLPDSAPLLEALRVAPLAEAGAGRDAVPVQGRGRPADAPGPQGETERDDDDVAGPGDGATIDEEIANHMGPVEIEDPEITAEFISEINEHFEVSDENLITLESEPDNEEAIASIFRAIHTIKGTTSFLGLMAVSKLAHKAEGLLDGVRTGKLAFEGEVVDATFSGLDLLKRMFKDLEAALYAGEAFTPDPELTTVFNRLKQAAEGGLAAPPRQPATPPVAPARVADAAAAAPARGPAREAPRESGGSNTRVRQTMKIDADRIDMLLEIIGELVIVESIVSQELAGHRAQSRELDSNLSRLTKITRSLQDIGMSMRLIPIDNTFRKMSRLLRDLAKKTGKKINLVMEGEETELDKGMVEKLGDPLMHMIRNSVDHGIEASPAERRAAGKDPAGTITLRAYHQGGNIHVEIEDDGRGLHRDVLAAKAQKRGLITKPDSLSDDDIYGLIFEPGFSTAKQVSEVSGRGVGMDVVRSNVLGMRGNIRITSEQGVGTRVTLVLPLTMAIIDGMILRVATHRYILPLLSIVESFQPIPGMITTVYGRGEMVPFRERLLPMVRLAELFDVEGAETDPTKAIVVVIEDSGRQLGLLVDELLGENQTVIKILGRGLGRVQGIAGATIMPDGSPGLVIDVGGLFKMGV